MPIKISIITPCFNAVKFIERAIDSVINQQDSNFEHIIIDGGSTDGTLDILKKYSHLKVLSEPDRGQSDAMNKGFALSSGEIVAYLNADDYYHEGTFTEIRTAFLNGDPDIVVGDLLIIQNGKERISHSEWRYKKLIHPNYFGFPYNPVSYFYKRDIQEYVGLFPVNEGFVMDYWFIIRAFHKAKVKKINRILGSFLIHEDCKTYSVFDSNALLNKTIAKFNSEQQVWHRIKYTLDEMIYKVLRLLRRI